MLLVRIIGSEMKKERAKAEYALVRSVTRKVVSKTRKLYEAIIAH